MSTVRVVVTEADSPDVPGTGTFTASDSGNMVGIGLMVAVILAAVGVVAVAVMRNRYRACRFMNKGKGFKLSDKGKKIGGLFSILLISATLIVPLTLGGNSTEQVFAGGGDSDLTIVARDIDLTLKKIANSSITGQYSTNVAINTSTTNGYTLGVYASTADLLPSDSSISTKFKGLTGTAATALTDDSWGISLVDNPKATDAVWYAVPTSESSAFQIANKTSATVPGDSTDIVYGFVVSDNMEPGTYTTTINYVATANVTTP